MAKLKAINPDAKPLSEIAEYRKPTKFAELDIILGEVVITLWEKIASLNDEIGSLKKTTEQNMIVSGIPEAPNGSRKRKRHMTKPA
jgi:hypothetical protein